MKLAIIGSRGITDIDLAKYINENVTEIVSGGAKGVDTLAEIYADKHKLSKHIIRPNYKKYGKAAPIVRNKDIIDMADLVLVFWDGKSKGTQNSVKYMEKTKKDFTLLEITKI